MGRSTIQVHARVRPPGANPAMKVTGNVKENYSIDHVDNRLGLVVNNSGVGRKDHTFTFDHIYDPQSTQEEVYNRLAQPVITDFINGFNCTIFAYGQTGSGKSYTMTGGSGSYNDRGLMPRALEQVFGFVANSTETREYEVWLSYIQIFNEIGYDLLGIPGENNPRLEDLPRVTLQEDSEGALHVRGLSAHKANNVEGALNVLWNGDLNRVVCATSQNQASSRSHCIFTIHIRSREPGSDVVRQSKFNFVDLAGSERVAKTHADGAILQQARYINQSLFYLEQVIHALGKKKTDPDCHVPYRNSMMTMFLRDSIGGNCRTIMLATIAVETQNMNESVSTAQFAMSVGQIENKASINEDIDPKLLIKRLKAENKALKEELKLLKEGSSANAARILSDDDMEYVRSLLDIFIADHSILTLDVGSWVRLQYALRLMRDRLAEGVGPTPAKADETEINKLRLLLQQRDAEVEVLTNMIGGDQPRPQVTASNGPMYTYDTIENDYSINVPSHQTELQYGPTESGSPHSSASTLPDMSVASFPVNKQLGGNSAERTALARTRGSSQDQQQQVLRTDLLSDPLKYASIDVSFLSAKDLQDEKGIFKAFLESYYNKDTLNQNKATLSKMYKEVKALAEVVTKSKELADSLKQQIFVIVERSGTETEETDLLKKNLAQTAVEYKTAIEQLKVLKVQVNSLESSLEQSKKDIKMHFVSWYKQAATAVASRENRMKASIQETTASNTQDIDQDIAEFYQLSSQIKGLN
ncbi:Kinesin motor domain protein [Giardia duodenalis]|uniref:Kinesin-like protein n=1 Tax=Giardia intestinalis TaxID=5741 RepID=V6TA11_GIAIN|nr:Kinesin motor domain protein [Giardia intestinalis]